MLVPAVDALCQGYPGLKLELLLSDRLVDIASEGIDIAVRAGVPPLDTRMAQRLGSHHRRLYASAAYLEREGTPSLIEDLTRFRLISNSGVAPQNQWRFEQDGQTLMVPVKGDVQADNTATVVSLALSGAGIARINSVVASPHVARGSLVPVLDAFGDSTRHDVHAVTLAARYRASRTRAVVGWLRTTFSAAGFSQDRGPSRT
ncbi:MAG: substrate binding domain-containing protein [Caldimonas sp.]